MSLILRSTKGSALTHQELDENLSYLRDMVHDEFGFVDPHLFGAKGDGIDTADVTMHADNQISTETRPFVAEDVGKVIWADFYSGMRTITAVDTATGRATISGAALTAGATNKFILFGTDDTVAMQAALDACQTSAEGALIGSGVSGVAGNRTMMGRVVVLRASRKYIIRSPVAGTFSALRVHRRTGVIGTGGFRHAGLVHAPGSYGHLLANAGAQAASSGGAFDDFLILRNFTAEGMAGLGNPNAGDLIHLNVSFDGYRFTDAYPTFDHVGAHDGNARGFFMSGRGEGYFGRLMATFCTNGFHISLPDSHFLSCNSGGSKKAGFIVDRASNCDFTACKSFYSGKNGGTVAEDCVNWLLTADQWRNGQCRYVNCHGQEARGSDWLIRSGNNVFVGCTSGDAGRVDGRPIGQGTLPAIRAGIELKGSHARYNVFQGFQVGPSVSIWRNGAAGTATANWNGTDAVYVGAGAEANTGDIDTLGPSTGEAGMAYVSGTGPVGGPGWTAALNPRLRVNGVAPTA